MVGVPDVFRAGGSSWSQLHVTRVPANPLLIVVTALTIGNLPELSTQVCNPSVLVYLPMMDCSIMVPCRSYRKQEGTTRQLEPPVKLNAMLGLLRLW